MNDNQDNTSIANALLEYLTYQESIWVWRPNGDPFEVLLGSWLEYQGITDINIINETVLKYPNVRMLDKAPLSEPAVVLLLQRNRGYQLKDVSRFVTLNLKGSIEPNLREFNTDLFINEWIICEIEAYAFKQQKLVPSLGIQRMMSRFCNTRSINEQKVYFTQFCPDNQADKLNAALETIAYLHCTMMNPECLLCPVYKYCKYINRKA